MHSGYERPSLSCYPGTSYCSFTRTNQSELSQREFVITADKRDVNMIVPSGDTRIVEGGYYSFEEKAAAPNPQLSIIAADGLSVLQQMWLDLERFTTAAVFSHNQVLCLHMS